jgi:hypothetical protein
MRPVNPRDVRLFYHVACLGHWRSVVSEQMASFSSAGLAPTIVALGSLEAIGDLRDLTRFGVAWAGEDVTQWETPTIHAAWQWCCEHPTGACIYVHTKGVSQPRHETAETAWRRVMQHWVVDRWRTNLRHLSHAHAVGVGWLKNKRYFAGNFWMARADWIASLPDPWEHRAGCFSFGYGYKQSWQIRFHAERWLGYSPEIRARPVGDVSETLSIANPKPIFRAYQHVVKERAMSNPPRKPLPQIVAPKPMRRNRLANIFFRHNTSKGFMQHYYGVYEWLLEPVRTKKPLAILEIGVAEGRSLRAWEEYFPNANIVGLDNDPKCSDVQRSRANIVIGSATDRAVLESLGEFDIIIDDASHVAVDQIATFHTMWPRTKYLYIVEDAAMRWQPLHMSQWAADRAVQESRIAGANRTAPFWTIFAGDLIAFKRNHLIDMPADKLLSESALAPK